MKSQKSIILSILEQKSIIASTFGDECPSRPYKWLQDRSKMLSVRMFDKVPSNALWTSIKRQSYVESKVHYIINIGSRVNRIVNIWRFKTQTSHKWLQDRNRVLSLMLLDNVTFEPQSTVNYMKSQRSMILSVFDQRSIMLSTLGMKYPPMSKQMAPRPEQGAVRHAARQGVAPGPVRLTLEPQSKVKLTFKSQLSDFWTSIKSQVCYFGTSIISHLSTFGNRYPPKPHKWLQDWNKVLSAMLLIEVPCKALAFKPQSR